ncbi:MAG: TonB-dependent receptor [Rhizomicrobium sp.]
MHWKNLLTCTTSALALTIAAGAAYAQADQQQVETVVVTGIRASLASAETIKKNSDQFLDSIVSEDIGKLPDNQVVDALQHVTGLQVQHPSGAGENDAIFIRGLPDVATTLNGREIFTTTGRYVSLADIPAELLAGVDVHKSTTAQDLEGGLAGLIDVRLHRPFDFDGPQVAGGLQGTYGTVSKHVDPTASLLLSDRWNTSIGEIGALLDISYKNRHYVDQDGFDYYSDQENNPGVHNPSTLGGIEYPGNNERGSANLSTQWRPNSNTEVFAEVFYTRYRNPNAVDFLIGLPGDSPSSAYTSVTDPNGVNELKTETICCFNLTSNQSFRDSTNTYQAATGVTWTGDNVTLSSEVDYTDSKYKRTGVIVDTAIFDTAIFDTNYNGQGTPEMTAGTPALWLVGSNYHPTQLFDQWTRQSGNEIDWRGDANITFGDDLIKSIDAGLRYTDRFGENRADWGGAISCYGGTDQMGADPALAASAACGGGWWANTLTASGGVMANAMSDSIGSFLSDKTWGLRKWMDVNPNWSQANIATLRAAFGQPAGAPAALPSNSFGQREQGYGAYFKVNYGLTVGDMPLDGNIGLRVVDTRSDTQAYVTTVPPSGPTIYTPITTSKETADWMPSFNAKLSIQDDLIARFAVSRTVTRPTFAELNPGLTLSESALTSENAGSAGNPNLSSVKANNVNIGLEYYFGKQDMLTGTAFYRQIDGYIQYKNADETHGVCGTPVAPCVYSVNRPYNSGQGFLQGFEAGYTQWYDMLPGLWSGLGLAVNATFIEGHFRDITTGAMEPYANVSKYSYNIIPMYEYGPVSFRVSYNWRSSFQVGYTFNDATSVNPAAAYSKPYGELGMSVSYNVDEHLVLTFDANNLTDSNYQDHFGQGAFAHIYPRDTRQFDQYFTLGLRYKM